MSGEVYDPVNQKVFDAYAVSDTNGHWLKKEARIDKSVLAYARSVKVNSKVEYLVVSQVNGKAVILPEPSNESKEIEITLTDLKSDIKEIKVTDSPEASVKSHIRVVYNRSDKEAQYSFTKAKTSKSDRKYVEVYFPFSVKITLADGYLFDKTNPVRLDKNQFSMSLYSDVIYTGDKGKYGEIQFNTSRMEELQYKLVDNDQSLIFELPYSPDTTDNYWGADMPLTASQKQGDFDFRMNFGINYKYQGISENLHTQIVVTSTDDYLNSDNCKKVSKVHITWGCLGKDSYVLTEDGKKKISAIQIGDRIKTDKGVLPVVNMITGHEEYMVKAGIEGDAPLLLSEKHPVKTDRGIIAAGNLTPGDKLMGNDGNFHNIIYLDNVEYNDAVYSIEFETNTLFYANGISVGDYLTTPDIKNVSKPVAEPLDPKLLAELEAWTREKNELMAARINV